MLGACNAILGVEDRVLRDGVMESEAGVDGTSPLPDATITPDGGPGEGGDADADAAEADADAAVVQCEGGLKELGEYTTWFGKVNIHRASGGSWLTDNDCASGADINTVAYCRKFWPSTVVQVHFSPTAELKPFTSGGGAAPTCGGVAPYPGEDQFACCAP